MPKKTKTYIAFIIGSLLFISIPVFSSPDFISTGSLLSLPPFQRSFLSYVLLLAFFYVNYLYFIPAFYVKKRYWLYGLLIIISYLLVALLPRLIFNDTQMPHFAMPMPVGPPRPMGNPAFFDLFPRMDGSSLFQFLLVFILSLLLKINLRLAAIQDEKFKTEISYLKAQINPHFLFNTLNSLYALSLEKSDATPEAIYKLSSMMRYVVTESNRDEVALDKELGYIKDYIGLQKLRIPEGMALNFIVNGSTEQKTISPMLLIPFVENAFKYGVNPEKNSEISITIATGEHSLQMDIINKKVNVQVAAEEKTEKGIKNTAQRLDYLYPDRHELVITQNDETFRVQLTLLLE